MTFAVVLAFFEKHLGAILATLFGVAVFASAVTFWTTYQNDKASVVQLTKNNQALTGTVNSQATAIKQLQDDQKANAALLSDLQAEKDAIQASKTKRIVQIEKQPNDGAAPASIRCAISGVCS